jgi:hypothetical protein
MKRVTFADATSAGEGDQSGSAFTVSM